MNYKSPKAQIKSLIWDKTGGKCWYCGKQTNPFGKSNDSFCIDHIEPRIKGGTNDISNLVPCCAYCNRVKSSKGIEKLRRFSVGENSRFYYEKTMD